MQLTVLNVLLTIVATGQIIMASVSRTKAPLACRRSLEQGLYSLLMLEHRGACVSTVCPSTGGKSTPDMSFLAGDMTVQCHYCTHYSSAIIVASYLVRMPPYTQAFCSLQVSFPPHTCTYTHNYISQTKGWAWMKQRSPC